MAITKDDVLIGNLYSKDIMSKYSTIGFTANSTKTNKGKLVMGKGNAKVVKRLFPNIDIELGSLIEHLSTYGVVVSLDTKVMGFQSKIHWSNKSSLELIKFANMKLEQYISTNVSATVAIPLPGVGLGGLRVEDVLPILLKHDRVSWYSLS